MKTGNSVVIKVVHPATREKGSDDHTIQAKQGTGIVILILSGSRISGLRSGDIVSSKFPLI